MFEHQHNGPAPLHDAITLLEKANAELQPELLGSEEANRLLAFYYQARELAASGRDLVAETVTSSEQVGSTYRPASELTAVSERDPFTVDPALVERAIRSHAVTQNLLAQAVRNRGIEPRSPRPTEPSFDLLWKQGETIVVAEVKSLTALNQEKQLRLGLGQVLRYRDLLSAARQGTVVAVLAVEREPTDGSWTHLCNSLDVRLWWPETFDRALGLEGLRPKVT